MRFGILGPLSVRDGGGGVPVTAGRDRVVLALLLLHAGQVVGVDDLVDALWDTDPPATARGQVQTCVSRLRRALPPGVIRTDPAGYAVSLGPDDLDATVFVRLVAEARAAGDVGTARRLFRAALDLWRGEALSGLDSRVVRYRAQVLDEQHLVATEDWLDLELDAGRDRDLVAELTGLVERFPLRERLRAQLMLALYRVGRQAEALAEYRRGRELLSRELGVEPGPALREMHRRLLTGAVQVPARPAESPVSALPRAVGDFTGRADLVDQVVRSAGDGPHLEVIDGMPGSGKTTLAVHVAGLLRDRYPDAQLFIDLQGHSATSPLDPAAALVTLLRQLGLPADRIPDAPDERILLWRAELAARRVVLILDNAASTTQVTPLLPREGMVLTLVTSRRRLLGLDGVLPRSIGVLAELEAVALLAAIAGDRVTAEPAAAAEVVRRCGGLPLAIRLAGARLAHRPRWRVADLARRLTESALPELAAEDRTVAGAFALSYGQLTEPARRMFRLLGAQPVERFGVLSAAALTGMSLDDTQDRLDDLVDVHLVEEPEPGRYRLHDLVREYAGTLAAPDGERTAARSALIDFHLHASAAIARSTEHGAADGDFPTGAPRRPELVARAIEDPAWFEAQRPYLLGLMAVAAEIGEPEHGWQLARSSWYFFFVAAYNDDLIAAMRAGLEIAAAAGDERGMAAMRNYLASGYYRTARYAEAARHVTDAMEYEIRRGDRLGEARGRGNLGAVLMRLGRVAESYESRRHAYEINRELQSVTGMATLLGDMSVSLVMLGRDAEALALARRSLQCGAELKRPVMVCVSLMHVGQARLRLGAVEPARRLLVAALRLARQIKYRGPEAEITNELGRVAVARHRFAEAVEHHLAARQMAREQGDRRAAAQYANDLAVALRAMGDVSGALDLHRHALTVARTLAHGYEEGRALSGIAACLEADDPAAAHRHRQLARAIFARMGVPER